MEAPAPPPEGEPRPGDRDRRGRDNPRFSSPTLAAVLVAVAVAIIAVLLGLRSSEPPQPPPAANARNTTHARIGYDRLLHIVGPYMPLYKNRLPPFHNLRPRQSNTTRTVIKPRTAAALVPGVRGIDPTQRALGVYPTVGKVVSPTGVNCTGTMVSENVMITADHCLPWNSSRSAWQSINFIPAYDASAGPPALYGQATVVNCVGINPPMPDGRDMAACKLSWSIGTRSGYAMYDWPDPDEGDDPVAWYTGRAWYSIGYPYTFKGGNSPAVDGPFQINEVDPDEDDGCSLLKTGFFADHGWSGGPAFSWATDGSDEVVLGAIATQCAGPLPNCVGATVTVLAAGMRIGALITYGILEWDPTWGFDRSP